MKIVVDSREQAPYHFSRYEVETITETLPAGDYSLPGFEDRVSIERKELNDLIGCLMGENRARFERELQKGKHYDVFAVVVEGSLHDVLHGKFKSQMSPKAAIQSIVAFQVRYRVPFMWAGNRAVGEYLTFSLLEKYLAEIEKRYERANKHQNMPDFQQNMTA